MTRYKLGKTLAALARLYPEARTELRFETPWQLLVATMLSAQCTDKRVNLITPRIFSRYPDAESLRSVSLEEMESLIFDCGLYHTKAKNILKTAEIIRERHHNQVPADRDQLMALPGVGRKTANVVVANAFGHSAIAVDTHVFRLAHRLGWSDAKDVRQTEEDLMRLLPKKHWNTAHHWLILHGRRVCVAVRPRCHLCEVARWCPRIGVAPTAERQATPGGYSQS